MYKYLLRFGIIKNTYCDYDKTTYNKNKNTILSGKDFKQLFPNYKPIKIIGNNKNNFKYNIGLNKDKYELSNIECSQGGLYFCDLSDLSQYLDYGYYGNEIAIITLADNSKIFIENNKCKSNLFCIDVILSIDEYINDLSQKDKIEFIKKDSNAIRFISNPNKELQLKAVKQNGRAIEYINNPDKDVQLAAIEENISAIKYINNPDKDIQLKAVKKYYGYAIRYINNPDKEIQLEAVKQDGYTIQYINNPDKDIQIEAVKENGLVIQYIKNPVKEVQLKAVKQNGLAIKYISYPDKEVQFEAIKQNVTAIKYTDLHFIKKT
jgi:hypothetical protein